MNIAIVGSRSCSSYDLVENTMARFFDLGMIDVIVSGGARGADALGKKYATEHGIEYQEFPADWERFGKSAGFERNKYIVTAADVVVAFWDGKSKGTEHTLEIAKKQKKPTIVEFF